MIANNAPAHVDLGNGDPVAEVFAWDDDGHPMILTPSGLAAPTRWDRRRLSKPVGDTRIWPRPNTHRVAQLVPAPIELYRSGQIVAFALCDHGCVHSLTYGPAGLLTTFRGYQMPGNHDDEGDGDAAAPQSD